MTGPQLPLKGIRVVDLTRYLAGPYLGSLLGSLGAEVIKVESARQPEWYRWWYRSRFASLNFNKLSVSISLREKQGVELVKQLVRVSHVVTESYRPGIARKMGLDYETLRQVNSSIVYCSFAGWGQSGPKSQKQGFAATFALEGGISQITGYPGEKECTEIRGSMDLRCAMRCAVPIIAALFFQRATGKGQYIDVSGQEVAASVIGEKIIGYQMNGREPVPQGNRDDYMAPHNCYRCKGEDEWVSIAVATDQEWRQLCSAMGMPELADDERFSDTLSRWDNQEALDPVIQKWTSQRGKFEVMEILQEAGVAAVPSFSNKDLFRNEHLKVRGYLKKVQHEKEGAVLDFGLPWSFRETPSEISIYGPRLGQDNDYVFREVLGLTDEGIAHLKSMGAIDLE